MKLKFIHTIVYFLMIVFLSSKNLQAQKINLKTDSTAYHIGDYITLQVQIDDPSHHVILWPNYAEVDTANHFEALGFSKIDTTQTGYHQTVSFICFDSGIHQFPVLVFGIQQKNKIDSLFSEPFQLTIKGVAVDTIKDFRGIKKPLDVPMSFKEWIPYIVVIWAALAVVLALLFYFLVIRKRKLKQQMAISETFYTPYEKAVIQLDKLEKENLPMKDEIKLYYSKLTDILREYLEKQYKIAALESTTDELMERLKYSTVDAASRQQLFELLSSADMVKFAKAKPGLHEHEAALISARKFVEQTKPVEQTI